MFLLKRRLQAQSLHVHQFRYQMVRHSLDHNVARLAQFVRQHAGHTTHLVGHSLGGVLALQTLKKFPVLPVDKVVCLGSPLLDSSAGRRFVRFKPGQKMLGETLPQAVFEKPLQDWTGAQPVGVIAGTRGVGLGKLIMRLQKPNDGMVTVAETCLPGITDHISLPVSHTGLVVSQAAAEQCAWFLRDGRFRKKKKNN